MADADFEQLQDAVRHKYNVEGLVGRGGMGAVYRARHVSLDAPVAIKILPVPASVGADDLARFRREAMLAARLANPHIVPVYEFEIRGDLAYLVMPLIDGVSLADRIEREGRLDLADAKTLLEQVGGALAFAHARGIIHRDVKPANILWEPANRRWLITDFGIARPVEHTGDDITSVGAVIGTPAYMPPEQAAGGHLDPRSDMYALAATVCEALTGTRLKPLTDRDEALAALRAGASPLPPRLAQALAAPLSLKPSERPASMQAWLDRVAQADRRGGPTWMTAAVVAAAAVAIAGGLIAVRPHATLPLPDTPVIAVLPFADATRMDIGAQLGAAFEDELRWVPNLQVVPAAALAGVRGAADSAGVAPDSIAAAVFQQQPQATALLTGSVANAGAGGLQVAVTLRGRDGAVTRAVPWRGPPDSLAVMVSSAVLDLFRPAEGTVSYRPALPGGGLAAFTALRAGDNLFRASAYDAAIDQYDRVLQLDSTYALAAFKRMLAEVLRTQPTRASRAVRSALEPVRRYRDNLDPLNRSLLEVYEILVTEGDVERAHQRVTDLTERYPFAVDAWFVRGYLEFYFGQLFGTPPARARGALERAEELDPQFAVVHGILAWIAVDQGDDQRARAELQTFLALDSTSAWAEIARLADSARFRGTRAALAVVRGVENRSTTTLELVALAGKGMQLQPAERELVPIAARELRDRATTADERAMAFRLQLGNALGAGQEATVDTLFREAPRHNVPRDELDRSLVLLAVTGLAPDVAGEADVGQAAARLAGDTSDPAGPWLAARWLAARDPTAARRARAELQRMTTRHTGAEILAHSLIGDLEARDRLAAGDTTGAYRRWATAVTRFQFEQVPVGLVASLWPLRLAWAQLAAARGDDDEVILATSTLEQSPGFMDQAARPIALPLRAAALEATGDRLGARDLRTRYAKLLGGANGRWTALGDSLLLRSGGS